jgi:hypothetical protein
VTPQKIDPIENPEQYRASLIKAGVLSKPEAAPEFENLKAQYEIKGNRRAARNDRGRVCYLSLTNHQT